MRRVRGLMSLERKYGNETLEKACAYALITEREYRHATMSAILKHKLYERRQLDLELTETPVVKHENIRGKDYYK